MIRRRMLAREADKDQAAGRRHIAPPEDMRRIVGWPGGRRRQRVENRPVPLLGCLRWGCPRDLFPKEGVRCGGQVRWQAQVPPVYARADPVDDWRPLSEGDDQSGVGCVPTNTRESKESIEIAGTPPRRTTSFAIPRSVPALLSRPNGRMTPAMVLSPRPLGRPHPANDETGPRKPSQRSSHAIAEGALQRQARARHRGSCAKGKSGGGLDPKPRAADGTIRTQSMIPSEPQPFIATPSLAERIEAPSSSPLPSKGREEPQHADDSLFTSSGGIWRPDVPSPHRISCSGDYLASRRSACLHAGDNASGNRDERPHPSDQRMAAPAKIRNV